MGDPMSFLTLNLTNVLVDKYNQVLWNKPIPSIIVGDDYLTFAQHKQHCDSLNLKIAELGLVQSGKFGISPDFGVFAETFLMKYHKGYIFLDVLKLRLLTSSPSNWGREHRATILGKGSQVKKLASWTPSKSYNQIVPLIFYDMFRREYSNLTITKFLGKLPFEFPTWLGGLDFPNEPGRDRRRFFYYLDSFELKYTTPIERYIESTKLSRLNCSRPRGTDTPMIVVYKFLSKNFGKYRLVPDPPSKDAFPTLDKEGKPELRRNTFYNRDLVVKYIESKGIKVPFEPGGFGILTKFDELCKVLSIHSVWTLLSKLDRAATFCDVLNAKPELKDNTFKRWLRRSHRFWKSRLEEPPRAYSFNEKDINLHEKRHMGYRDLYFQTYNLSFNSFEVLPSMFIEGIVPFQDILTHEVSDLVIGQGNSLGHRVPRSFGLGYIGDPQTGQVSEFHNLPITRTTFGIGNNTDYLLSNESKIDEIN